eukprot:m.1056597 g.1056597  ORF g.1056597 m.1056597 type:complete len:638 (+) comp24198_c0_seq25:317-2230(+)
MSESAELSGSTTEELLRRLLLEQERQREENRQLREAFEEQQRETAKLRLQLEAAKLGLVLSPAPTQPSDPADKLQTGTPIATSDAGTASIASPLAQQPGNVSERTATTPLLTSPLATVVRPATAGAVTSPLSTSAPTSARNTTRRSRHRSSIDPSEVQAAVQRTHRRSHSDVAVALDSKEGTASGTKVGAKSGTKSGTKDGTSSRVTSSQPRRSRHSSLIDPAEVLTASKDTERKKTRRSRHDARSRSEINSADIRAAFEDKRRTARPHPFIKNAGSASKSAAGVVGSAATPPTSRRYSHSTGNTPPTQRKGTRSNGGTPPTQRRASAAPSVSEGRGRRDLNPYPKRMHPKLSSPQLAAKKPTRRPDGKDPGTRIGKEADTEAGNSVAGDTCDAPKKIDPVSKSAAVGQKKAGKTKRLPMAPADHRTSPPHRAAPVEPSVIRVSLDGDGDVLSLSAATGAEATSTTADESWDGAYDEDEDDGAPDDVFADTDNTAPVSAVDDSHSAAVGGGTALSPLDEVPRTCSEEDRPRTKSPELPTAAPSVVPVADDVATVSSTEASPKRPLSITTLDPETRAAKLARAKRLARQRSLLNAAEASSTTAAAAERDESGEAPTLTSAQLVAQARERRASADKLLQ